MDRSKLGPHQRGVKTENYLIELNKSIVRVPFPMGKKRGRPLKYQGAQVFEEKINDYFSSLSETVIDENGREHSRFFRPPTISGLAVFLGCSRQTLLNYTSRPEFMVPIKRALSICEAYLEEQLITGRNTMGVMFALKNNYGWRDRIEEPVDGEPSIVVITAFASGDKGQKP